MLLLPSMVESLATPSVPARYSRLRMLVADSLQNWVAFYSEACHSQGRLSSLDFCGQDSCRIRRSIARARAAICSLSERKPGLGKSREPRVEPLCVTADVKPYCSVARREDTTLHKICVHMYSPEVVLR